MKYVSDKQIDVFVEQMGNVMNFKGVDFYKIEDMFALEMARSIIRLLKKFGVNPGDKFIYDEKMARLRDMGDNYGISYDERKNPFEHYCYTNFECDGKYYCLDWLFYMDDVDEDGERMKNSIYLQIVQDVAIHKIYNYLRMENNLPKSKRRFSIERKE